LTTPASVKDQANSSGREFKVVFSGVTLSDDQATGIREAIQTAVLQSLANLGLDKKVATDALGKDAKKPSGLDTEALSKSPFMTDGLVVRPIIPD